MKITIKNRYTKKTTFQKIFGDSPLIKVIDYFLDNQEWDYTKIQIAKSTKISRVTLNDILEKLLKSGFIKATRTVGNSTFYQINGENIVARNLIQFDLNLSLGQMPQGGEAKKQKIPA